MSALAAPSPASRSVPFAQPIRTIQPAQTPQAIQTTDSIQTVSNFQVVQPTQQVTINPPTPPIPNMYTVPNSTDTLSNLPMELLLTVMDFLPPESRAILSISTRRLHERLGPLYPSQNLYAVRFSFGSPISTFLKETKERMDRFLDLLARDVHDGRLPCKTHYMIHRGDFPQQAAEAATQAAAAQPAIPQPTFTPITDPHARASRRLRVRRRMVRRKPSSDPSTAGPQLTYSTRGPTTSQGPPPVTAPNPQPQQNNGPLPSIPPGTQPRNPTPYYGSRRRADRYGTEFSASYEPESEYYLAERAQRDT
ncbi:hypothetical protein DL95DRAFT_461407 [Leptodontidium sp. 2 PMI_412]|nr:hypothetical protein DL95DRAFT_461407 [Leptodontidium sp. 2 PMI_412]